MALSVANETTDGNGVTSWDATSIYNGPGTSTLRVKAPTSPAAGQPHRFLHILPVKPDLNTDFGDGLEAVRLANGHNLYNCTLVAFTTPTEPWIGDHPSNADHRYESFLVLDLIPWCEANLASSGTEEHWLLSFSKGGYSALTLFFRYRDVFAAAAAWDAPIDIDYTTGAGWQMDEAYGSQANFEAEYKIPLQLAGWLSGDLLTTSRLWLSGDTVTFSEVATYQAHMQGLRDDLITAGARFWYRDGATRVHAWDEGWVPEALAGLAQLSHGTTQDLSDHPGTTVGLDPESPFATDLEIALLFQGANANHCYNMGAAGALGTPRLPNDTMVYITDEGTPALEQDEGNGVNFGTSFTGLDASDKTIVVWCRPDVLNVFQGLLSKDFDNGGGDDGGWALLLSDHGRLYWHADSGKDLIDDGALTLSTGTWYMLAVVWDLSAKQAQFYINGTLNSTKSDATMSETSSGTAQLLLGKIRDQSLFAYTGAYSQVRAYSRVLAAEELETLTAFPYAGYVGFAPQAEAGGQALLTLGVGRA